MTAIILDGQLKSALAVVRSLGAQGIELSVGAERGTGMALHSRYANAQFTYPSPYTNQEAFVEAVKNEALRFQDKPVVYALSDATFLSLFKYREALSACVTLVFPEEKSVEIAFDKAATYSLARVSGVPTIETSMPEFEEEVERLAESFTYPLVVKTRKSVTWNSGVGRFGSAKFIHTKNDLCAIFLKLKNELGEAPLIQPLIFGEEYGVEMLAHKGKAFATVVHHRIRSLSPTGGASVLKESLEEGDLRVSLITYAEKLVKKLNWSGPIMVEFKVESDSRTPYLMEINGRFWGSLPLAVASGVDIPYLYYEYVKTGVKPKIEQIAHGGITTRHFLGDVRNLVQVFFARDAMRSRMYPRRLHALQNFFKLPKDVKNDVWSRHDMKPALYEFIDIGKKIWK